MVVKKLFRHGWMHFLCQTPFGVFAGVLQPSLGLCRHPDPDFALAGSQNPKRNQKIKAP